MISPQQLDTLIIQPVLNILGFELPEDPQRTVRAALLLGTAAVESNLGMYLKQIPNGPALGIFQMEPATHDDIWDNYLRYRPGTVTKVSEASHPNPVMLSPRPEYLIYNLRYAAAMAAIHYYRVPSALPRYHKTSVESLGYYWKANYNTLKGKGTVKHFVERWNICKLQDIYPSIPFT